MNGRRAKEKHRREASERRRAARYKLRHAQSDSEEFGFMVGWSADSEHCAEVRKTTHDNLIKQMGSTRAGGVQWLQWSGPEALDVLRDLRENAADPTMLQYLTRIRRKVEEYGGFVILAKAPAHPGRAST